MQQFTRPDTVDHHLIQGGFTMLWLTEAQQKKDRPTLHHVDAFCTRTYRAPDGTLLTVAGAYGPNWYATLAEMQKWLQQPSVGYTVIVEAPDLREHEVLVRWATREELQPRRQAATEERAALRAEARRQQAERDAEDAGQASLF
jgi:hypothetical protein